MSITDNYLPVKQSGDGVTADFSANWNIIASSYIRVFWEDKTTGVQTAKILDTNFSLVFDENGFTVTFLPTFIPPSTVWVVIGREVEIDQSVPYKTSQGFQGEVQENSYDKLTAICQDLQNQVDRGPKLPLGFNINLSLPAPEALALLGWNTDEDALINYVLADVSTITVSTFGASLITAVDATAAKIILEIPDSYPSIVNNFRITLTSGTPVLTSDVTAATTIYFTPYKGNYISLYSGTEWVTYSSAQISIAVPATTNTMYDLFVYDNAGTLTLEATAWTNDTTRATALVFQDGVYVKTGALTRRYVGSFRTTAVSGQTQVKFGGTATGGSEAWIGIWNYYNRLPVSGIVRDDTNTWNYTTATWRSANNSAAMRYSYVCGVQEDVHSLKYCAVAQNTNAGVNIAAGVGYDSTSAPSGLFGVITSPVASYSNPAFAEFGTTSLGFHYLQALEYSVAIGTTIWVGDAGVSFIQSGMRYEGVF